MLKKGDVVTVTAERTFGEIAEVFCVDDNGRTVTVAQKHPAFEGFFNISFFAYSTGFVQYQSKDLEKIGELYT